MVKVETIVSSFLSAQSLKVLPQGPFSDAVNKFVAKDDKHAMELFVSEHLSGQVQQMLGLESDDEDLNSAMDIYRTRVEEQLASGAGSMRVAERKRVLNPKPAHWDSDFDGSWEEAPDAWTYEDVTGGSMAPTTQLSRSCGKKIQTQDDNDDDEQEPQPAKPKRAPRKAPAKAPAKKAPAKKPAARSKKAAAPPSDDEDVVMDSEEEVIAPPAKRASRARQTTLPFASQKNVVEVSDDEISDGDAFEEAPAPAPPRRGGRRR